MQNNLNDLALSFLHKAYHADLTLFELESKEQDRLYCWSGRITLTNCLAYHQAFIQKDVTNALKHIRES